MKKGIAINAIIIAGLYLSGSFVSLEVSFTKWSEDGRMVFIMFSLTATFLYWALIHDHK
jgi:hypothetical protein